MKRTPKPATAGPTVTEWLVNNGYRRCCWTCATKDDSRAMATHLTQMAHKSGHKITTQRFPILRPAQNTRQKDEIIYLVIGEKL